MAINFETAVRMLAFLRQNSPIELATVAQIFSISEKEVRRYCELLNDSRRGEYFGESVEVEIQDDEDGVWIEVFEAQGIDEQVQISADESVAIMGGLRYLAAFPELVDGATLNNLIVKLQTALGIGEEVIQIGPASADPEIVQLLRGAIDSESCVDLTYGAGEHQAISERTIEPLSLHAEEGVLYLRAYCQAKESIRTFRVDRILTAQASAAARVGQANSADGPIGLQNLPVAVRVRVAHDFLESFRPETVSHIIQNDSTIEATVHVASETWLIQLVLASAGAIEVIGPPEIRQAIISRAESWLKSAGE